MDGIDLDRLAPSRKRSVAFFLGFLRRPKVVASVVPSSRFLARRVADAQWLARARSVVELGPGTGVTTRAILDALPRDSRLLAIEINEEFVSLLKCEEDVRLIAHCGSAATLSDTVAMHGMSRLDVVISGVPFSTMPAALGRRILEQVWSCLAPGGVFIAYQLREHVAHLARPFMGVPATAFELRNVPPMRIYRWRKPQGKHLLHA